MPSIGQWIRYLNPRVLAEELADRLEKRALRNVYEKSKRGFFHRTKKGVFRYGDDGKIYPEKMFAIGPDGDLHYVGNDGAFENIRIGSDGELYRVTDRQ